MHSIIHSATRYIAVHALDPIPTEKDTHAAEESKHPQGYPKMIDFIFQVDLSTIYVIIRRDFASPHDKTGALTAPLGAGFYYSAAEANEAARQHCVREGMTLGGSAVLPPHHGEKDGLYRGGCVTREIGVRDRFEVRVRRLKARGAGLGAGAAGSARLGSRGGSGLGGEGSIVGRAGRGSEERRRPRTSTGTLMVVQEEDRAEESKENRVKEEEQGEEEGDDDDEDDEKRPRSGMARRCSSVLEKRGGRMGRLWGSIKRMH